ncbi:MAG: hypothetical protein M3Y44_15890 [Actinomycetota bacterium]|nr:hypothetical protein [Actinomycetota bacterium]
MDFSRALRAISAPSRDESDTALPPVDVPAEPGATAQGGHLSDGLLQLLDDCVALQALSRDAVTAPVGPPPPGETAKFQFGPWQSSGGPGRNLRLAFGVAVVTVLVVVDGAALVHVNRRTAGTVRVANLSSPAHVVAAASWAARELSHDSKIVADPAMHATLAADRFIHVQTPAPSSSGTALAFDYIVSTAALRATAKAGNPIYRALSSSVPIAVFGSGGDQIVVRQVSTAPSAGIAVRRSIASDSRRTAERQLLTNPAIRADGPARAALRAGQLDLRAATVLALMANSSHVDIVSVNVDEPERAAGLPARSVDVRTDADAGSQVFPSTLPSLYQPITDRLLPDGTHRLVWAIDPEPAPALN